MMCNILTFFRFATINSSDFLKFGYSQHVILASLSSASKRNTFATSLLFFPRQFLPICYPSKLSRVNNNYYGR